MVVGGFFLVWEKGAGIHPYMGKMGVVLRLLWGKGRGLRVVGGV